MRPLPDRARCAHGVESREVLAAADELLESAPKVAESSPCAALRVLTLKAR
jgi:hypothetical protein